MSTPFTESNMPLIPDAAVIEPKRGQSEKILPSRGLVVFTPQDVELIVRMFSSIPKRSHRLYLADVYGGTWQDREVAIAGPSLGAPQTILILEKLIALGVEDVLALGWCGSLQPHVSIGDIVIPVGALSEEGTSAHYPIELKQPGPAPSIVTPLRKALMSSDLKTHEGIVWSTDAPYRETVAKVLRYQAEGVLAVEMEVSALFTLACFRRIRLAAALIVSDDLHSLKWIHGFRTGSFNMAREKMAGLVLNTLAGLD